MKAFTLLHVLISLAGIFAGFVVPFGLLAGKPRDGWTKFFLETPVATSVTGFFFPFHGLTPAIVTGIISMVVLAVAMAASLQPWAECRRPFGANWNSTTYPL